MLASLKVGLSEGSGERLSRSYAYNSFGDIIAQAFASARQMRSQKPSALTEETTSYSFSYDGLGRLTSAYGRTYSYDAANRLTSFNGQVYNYYDSGPYHAVDRIDDFDRFDYDASGNMVKRNKGLTSQQTLVWDAENRLSQVQDNNGDLVEQYWYGVGGARVKKTSGTTTTYTFFGHYEEEVTDGVTTTISHHSFGGLRVAVKRGSTSLTTQGSTVEASRTYYAYGSERSASGDLQTDRTFTGQKSDATGLLYYNARYYDPALGTFISPDTIIPDPGMVIDYNRFLYVRGNPFKYTDPSGHDLVCVKGGPPSMNSGKDAFYRWCFEVAIRAGWDEEIHGPIHYINNAPADADAIADAIIASEKEDPSRPIVFLAHSWGGPATMWAAEHLDAAGIDVDLAVVLDYEDYGRFTHTRPDGAVGLPPNVKEGVGMHAKEIGTEDDDIWRYDDGVDVMLNHDGTPALNIPIDEVVTAEGVEKADHYNLMYAENTIAIATRFVRGILRPFGGGPVQRFPHDEPLLQFLY